MVIKRRLLGWTLIEEWESPEDYFLDLAYGDQVLIGACFDASVFRRDAVHDLIVDLRAILRRNPRFIEDLCDG